jgi:hypothetical protein
MVDQVGLCFVLKLGDVSNECGVVNECLGGA